MRAAIALAVALATAPVVAAANHAAQIGTWSTGLYAAVPKAPAVPPPRRALPPEAACIDAILGAEKAHAIADHTLLAVGFTEAGRKTADGLFTVWPWTVNAEGVSRYFSSKAEAIAFVRDQQAHGVRSIDVGCLQINLRWHPKAFRDLEEAFDPAANAAYSARFLADLRAVNASLADAVARYHSAQSERGEAYRARVEGNRRWVNRALAYLETLADGPPPAAFAWGRAELGRLAFLSSLYADGPVRPLLPKAE